MDVFLLFLYIFNFNFIKGVSLSESALIVLAFILLKCMLNDNCNNAVFKFFHSKENKSIFLTFFLCILFSFIVPLVQFTFDFSYFTTLIHQLIIVFTGFLLVGYLKWNKTHIIESVIYVFFIQSIIQFVSFVSPYFLKLTDIFRSDELIEIRYRSYRGFRGLAISGSGFFGLSVSYAILFVLLSYYLDKWEKPITIKLLIVTFLIFGAISAGRTALIGVAFFFIIFVFRSLKRFNKQTLYSIGASIAVISLAVILLRGPVMKYMANSQSWTYMRYYLFQFIENDSSGQGAGLDNITSLSHMINDMYFALSPKQILLGDGMFTGGDGKYYMHTDVGIMRNLLFFGILGTLVLYYYQYKIIFIRANKKAQLLPSFLLLIIIIMEIKGQTMGFLIISQALLIVICTNYEEIFQEETVNARIKHNNEYI